MLNVCAKCVQRYGQTFLCAKYSQIYGQTCMKTLCVQPCKYIVELYNIYSQTMQHIINSANAYYEHNYILHPVTQGEV